MGPVLCVFLKLMSCLDDLTILVYLGDDMQSAAQRVESVDGLRSCMLACLSFFWPFAILEAVSLVDELGGHQKQMKQHSKRHLAFGYDSIGSWSSEEQPGRQKFVVRSYFELRPSIFSLYSFQLLPVSNFQNFPLASLFANLQQFARRKCGLASLLGRFDMILVWFVFNPNFRKDFPSLIFLLRIVIFTRHAHFVTLS